MCVCVCKCAWWISCFRATHFLEVNVNANRVRRVLIPMWSVVNQIPPKDYCQLLKPTDCCNSWIIHNWITFVLFLSYFASVMYRVISKINNLLQISNLNLKPLCNSTQLVSVLHPAELHLINLVNILWCVCFADMSVERGLIFAC